MGFKLPVSVLEIFHILDIPERFFTERSNAIYFEKLCDKMIDSDYVDLSEDFILPHIHDRYHTMMNYFFCGALSDPETFSGIMGRQAILCGLFAILYTYWDYKFDDINVGIDSGIRRLRKYQDQSIMSELIEKEKYVCEWIRQNVDIDNVCWLLKMLKRPYSCECIEKKSSQKYNTLKLLRDTVSYGPLYCVSYYPDELQESQIYTLITTLLVYYGAASLDEVSKCFNTYFRSPLIHEPYTEFTKSMIEIYNRNRSDKSNILNDISIEKIKKFFDIQTDLDMLKAKNPLPIDDNMNIY